MGLVQALVEGHSFDESTLSSDPQFSTGGPKTVTLGNYIYVWLVGRYYNPPEWRSMSDNLGNTYTLYVDHTNGQLELRLFVAEVTNAGSLTYVSSRCRTSLPAVSGMHVSVCSAEFTEAPSFDTGDYFDYNGGASTVDEYTVTVNPHEGLLLYCIGMWQHPTAGVGGTNFTAPNGYEIAAQHVYTGSEPTSGSPLFTGCPCVAMCYAIGGQDAGDLTSSWDGAVQLVSGVFIRGGVDDTPFTPQIYRVRRP